MSGLARRIAALDTKLQSLGDEIAAWRDMPAKPSFAVHASQIEDVCGSLADMRDHIKEGIAAAGAKAGGLTHLDIARFEREILAAFHIWQCYREKFAFRLVASAQETLSLLDELAWQAYRVARDRAVATKAIDALAVREPPLVFPNVRWSPFARSRETAYDLDEATGALRAVEGFDHWLDKLPVPLVGIPWYQLAHLPDGVFIGHEVGHLVEDDLGLDDQIRAAVTNALLGLPSDRLEAWRRRWRSEVFADVYGVLTTGSAYAAVLLDLLALDQGDVAKEVQPDPDRPAEPWSAYPTRALRARLVCEAVRQLPASNADPDLFRRRADELEAVHGVKATHGMTEYDDDVPKVVGALLSTPFPALGAPLTKILPFDAARERQAAVDAAQANGASAVAAGDIRTLFAGVARAFLDDPASYRDNDVQGRFRKCMLLARTQGVRGVEVQGFIAAPRAKRHAQAARSVLDLVSGRAKTP